MHRSAALEPVTPVVADTSAGFSIRAAAPDRVPGAARSHRLPTARTYMRCAIGSANIQTLRPASKTMRETIGTSVTRRRAVVR